MVYNRKKKQQNTNADNKIGEFFKQLKRNQNSRKEEKNRYTAFHGSIQ